MDEYEFKVRSEFKVHAFYFLIPNAKRTSKNDEQQTGGLEHSQVNIPTPSTTIIFGHKSMQPPWHVRDQISLCKKGRVTAGKSSD